MPKILHFADAHIDIANFGRRDPESGLPLRVIDFLKSLDTIVQAAIDEDVDLVLFAGDAYKDRNPAPTFQREWGKRIMRLSRAGIPTLLLVGNHDLSPALGRAHALDPFITLEVPQVQVLDKPAFLGPEELNGLPLQMIALPWISRSGLMAYLGAQGADPGQVYQELETRLVELVQAWLAEANPALPIGAYCPYYGAGSGVWQRANGYAGRRPGAAGSLMRDPRLDYVALGHIHKPQDLNAGSHPPVIYPGSIERVDWGEARDEKYFIVAEVERGATRVEWRKLAGRPFIDCFVRLESPEEVTARLLAALPPAQSMDGAVLRLIIEYPREWEVLIDEAALREHCNDALEFHLVKRPQAEARIRLPEGQAVGSLTPLELLEKYWSASHVDGDEQKALSSLAQEVIDSLQAEPAR